MLMIGLTGGIGAGKTAVARRLVELGAVLIDSDALAREAVAAGQPGHGELLAAFGDAVLGPDGEIDRGALGRIVFADENARRRLEAIVHPRVRTRAAELAASAPPDAVVVNDVPLLVEANLAANFDMVIVVLADEETRVRRLVAERGLTEADAQARLAAQATDEQRRAVADIVIVNDGTLDDLRAKVDEVWRTAIAPRVSP